MESDLIKFLIDNGFAIVVTVYLLYERSVFNEKITATLDKISDTLTRIESRN